MTSMLTLSSPTPIIAIVYSDSNAINRMLRTLADHLVQGGFALAGFVQDNVACEGKARCDMVLEELSSGQRFGISEERGRHARGCMLDVDELLRAVTRAMAGLDAGVDLVVVNKFGKTEAEGGGFGPLIAESVSRGVPVLIGVPARNLAAWREFAGEFASEHAIEQLGGDCATVLIRLGITAAAPIASAAA